MSQRVGFAALWLVLIASLFGCTQSNNDDRTVDTSNLVGAALPENIQCMIDQGFTISKSPGPDQVGYEMSSPYAPEQAMEIMSLCNELVPPTNLTDEEVEDVYERWVDEWQCLVDRGYHPTDPPSVQRFIEDWKGAGPWMPIDGLQSWEWSDAEYDENREACGLEFYQRS